MRGETPGDGQTCISATLDDRREPDELIEVNRTR
jgi:hypothetical protein